MRAEPTFDEGSLAPLLPAGSQGGSSGGHQQSDGRGAHLDHLGRILRVASERQVRAMCADILRFDRDYPIVVLTFGEGEKEPGFSLSAIRLVLDPRVPIYLLGTFDLCRRLAQALGLRLAVDSGNARILWPGVSRDSDPADRLISALELSRPNVKGYVALTQQRLQTTEHQLAENLRRLRRSRVESDAVLARAEAAEEVSLAIAEQQLVALKLEGLDVVELGWSRVWTATRGCTGSSRGNG